MRRRLILMAAATTSMVVVAFLVPLGIAVQTIAANEALNEAESEARSLAAAIATVQDPDLQAELVRSAVATSAGRLSVWMPDGRVLGAPSNADTNVALARSGRSFTAWTPDGAAVLVPVLIPQAGVAVIEVALPNSRLHRGVTTAWLILTATGIGLVLLAVFVADRIARDVVLPTRALARAAQQVARGELQTRVEPDGPPEVVEVGRAFNVLAARITDLLSAEREAAADLSHRLRTPLTALRLDVERLPADAQVQQLGADIDAVERAVTDVIRELRDQTRKGAGSTIDLVAAVRERLAFWKALAEQHGMSFSVTIPPQRFIVPLSQDEANAMVDILLGNVFAHTSEKVGFKVSIEGGADDEVNLVVEDDGPGFPASMIARGASGGGSTGLGLDIVRRAAESGGGSLSISERPGGGARVIVMLRRIAIPSGRSGASRR